MNDKEAIKILKLNIKLAGSKMPTPTLEALYRGIDALEQRVKAEEEA